MKSKDIVPLTEVYAYRRGMASYHGTQPAVVLSTTIHVHSRYSFSGRQSGEPAFKPGKSAGGYSNISGIPIVKLSTGSIKAHAALIANADIQTVLADGKLTIGEDVLLVSLVQSATIRSTWSEYQVEAEQAEQNAKRLRKIKQEQSNAVEASNTRLRELADQLGLGRTQGMWSLPDPRYPFYGSPGLYAREVKIKPDVLTELLTELVEFRKTGRFEVPR